MTNLITGSPPVSDPLVALAAPANPGGCVAVNNQINLVGNRCYSGISTTLANLNFGPGLYYLTGPVLIGNNTNVTGAGVLLYFAGNAAQNDCRAGRPAGCINVANNPHWQMSAQLAGPYKGILFYQSPTNHLDAQFDGNNPFYDLSGVMYFPGAEISFRNGINASNDCMLFVAKRIVINNGNGAFSNVCAAYGGSPILTVTSGE